MPPIADTISEHFIQLGKARGFRIGFRIGKAQGLKKAHLRHIELLETLYQQNMIPKDYYEQWTQSLHQKIRELDAQIAT